MIIPAAILARTGASLFQLYWALDVKAGIADIIGYHAEGLRLYEEIRRLDFERLAVVFSNRGTGFPDAATGFIYALIGPTIYGAALVFAVQRYKGLGEMNPDQLWETTMNPETRQMLQVNIDDVVEVDDVFSTLMSEAVAPRKSFIQAYARSVTNLDV